jgi:AcrR family transcriptional regulator
MPRAGLDTDRVVAAAAQIADADGLDGLSLAALAGKLGVRPPSLYAHVGGLDDLRRRVALRALRELTAVLQTAAAGRANGDALRAVAHAYRAYALEHPGSYASLQRAPAPDDAEAIDAAKQVVEVVLAVLRGYGIEGDDALHATRAVRSALHGFVAVETAGGFGLPLDIDESFDRLVSLLDVGLIGMKKQRQAVVQTQGG